MNDQQQTTGGVDESSEQRGLDRRRFLLGTTAVTAGAWAAPSILTIDRAFGAHTGTPCPCADNRSAVSVLLTGTLLGNPVNDGQCPDEGQFHQLPGGLGHLNVAEADCQGCQAHAEITDVSLVVGGHSVLARALTSDVRCCPDGSQGHTAVYDLVVDGTPVPGGSTPHSQSIGPISVHLNQHSGDEYIPLRIVLPALGPLGATDLKVASSRCVNGASA